jgi:hypothetical protein
VPYSAKEFPPKADIARVAIETDYYNLLDCKAYDYDGKTDKGAFKLKEFFSNDTKKAEILAKALNLAPLIAEAGTDFLFGEPFEVVVDDEGREDVQDAIDDICKRNKIQDKGESSSLLLQAVGHAHFKLYGEKSEKKTLARIQEVPFSYYYPNFAGVADGEESENIRLAVNLTKVDEGGVTRKYIYVEDYFMRQGKAVIEYALYQDKGGQIGDPVSLAEFDLVTKNGKPVLVNNEETKRYEEVTSLDELPIVSIHLRRTVMERHGQSIYKRIMPLLEEINDRLTQISLQFLKHLNAKLQLPESAVVRDPKTGEIKRVDLEVILAKADDAEAKYIINENPLIEDAFKHLDRLIRECAKLTHTPDSFLLEDEKGGVEKAESLKVRMMMFFKRIRNYQRKYDEAIKKLIRIALKIEGVKDAETVPLKIIFDKGIPKDWEHDVEVWGSAFERGLASRQTAVSRFQGLDDEETEEEIKRIEEEEAERVKTQMTLLNDEGGNQE